MEQKDRFIKRHDLVEPALSYDIVGALIEVSDDLGPGLKESMYQRAVAKALAKRGIPFRQQVYCPVLFKGEKVGHIFLDFLISDKIVLELKRGEHFARNAFHQTKEYLNTLGLQLAIIANFTDNGIQFRRVVHLSEDGHSTRS